MDSHAVLSNDDATGGNTPEIRFLRESKPGSRKMLPVWPLALGNCYRVGEKYRV